MSQYLGVSSGRPVLREDLPGCICAANVLSLAVEKGQAPMSDNLPTKSEAIVTICAAVLKANLHNCQADCSGYLKQVAAKLGVALPNVQANGIIDYLSGSADWMQIGNDANRASQMAGEGSFVVAGLKEGGHGHVAIVVPGWSRQGFPMGYWGSLRGAEFAGANKSLTLAWTRADLALVSYFAIEAAAVTK
jgi:hypothetical protein